MALAVATMLAAMLTRFMIATRWNSAQVREALEIQSFGDGMLQRLAPTEIREGSSTGRNGFFSWVIDVSKLNVNITARRVSKDTTVAADKSPERAAEPLKAGTKDSPTAPSPTEPKATDFVPYHVTIVVQGRAGRKYAADTVRLGVAP